MVDLDGGSGSVGDTGGRPEEVVIIGHGDRLTRNVLVLASKKVTSAQLRSE